MASNGTEATRKGGQWRTWQSDEDIPQRKILIQHMYVLLFVLFGRSRAAKRTEIVFFFLVFSLLVQTRFQIHA
jgi:hypothetical protein